MIRRVLIIAAIVLTTVGCDQVTKHIARVAQPQGSSLLGGLLQFQLAFNPGAFLSLGHSLPPHVRAVVFGLAGALFTVALFLVLWHRRHLPVHVGTVALALMAAGALGNVIDRVFRGGLVTDFCVLRLGPLHTGIFNVADIALTVGTLLFVAFVERDR